MMCGDQTALTSIGGRAKFYVDELFRNCKTVSPSGLATNPVFVDDATVGGSNSSAQVFNLNCPNDKFADRIVGRAGDLVRPIEYELHPSPLAAIAINELTLGTTSVSGTSIVGSVEAERLRPHCHCGIAQCHWRAGCYGAAQHHRTSEQPKRSIHSDVDQYHRRLPYCHCDGSEFEPPRWLC